MLALVAPVRHKKVAKKPISVTMPDGDQVHSTHIGDLDMSLLPAAAWFCHNIPGLAKYLLISVVKLCKAGRDVRFTKFGIGVDLRYRERMVLHGSKCTRTGLWMVSLEASPDTPPAPICSHMRARTNFQLKLSKTKQ